VISFTVRLSCRGISIVVPKVHILVRVQNCGEEYAYIGDHLEGGSCWAGMNPEAEWRKVVADEGLEPRGREPVAMVGLS
jgi:hypothetical protein